MFFENFRANSYRKKVTKVSYQDHIISIIDYVMK